jgi:23S rRNA pseudouridine1911/1915/1917 synthase
LESFVIESFFRPFGPGRKQVRPVLDKYGKDKDIAKDRGGYYRTEVVNVTEDEYYTFSIKLRRGFRHQIRCHLAWIGCPVLNDPLYGEQAAGDSFLALRSTGLFFVDPRNGTAREYRLKED